MLGAIASPLVERDEHLSLLNEICRRAHDSCGRVVVIGGEAGVGKTSLLRSFANDQRNSSVLYWGSCDALSTPRPFGPLFDIAPKLDAGLAQQLESGVDPGKVFAQLLTALAAHKQLPILIFEDVHWADTATLDLIKFLGRRMTALRALLLLSLRSDEVARGHPVSRVLGEISREAIQRLELAPLSIDGVRELANGVALDVADLHRTTGGNPFFVSELIATGGDMRLLPVSVRDAVRSRRARIATSGNTALDVISIFPSPPADWLSKRMLGAASARGPEQCVAAGLLVRGDGGELSFKHELARLAVLDDLSEQRRQALHRKAAKVLSEAAESGITVQVSHVIHHAAGAGDGREVLKLAPLAAAEAARVGAHAQAAAHLAAGLRYVSLATSEEAAQLYETWSYEAALAVKIDEKIIDARHQAIRLWRSVGRRDKVGLNLRWLARLHWYRGEATDADRYLKEALAELEALPPGPELAMAYAIRSQMLMLQRRSKEAIDWGNRAIALARKCDVVETLVHALNTVGTSKLYLGRSSGKRLLEESLKRSLENGLHEQAARAYTNITSCAVSRKDFALAEIYVIEGIKFDSEHDLDAWTHYLVGYQAQMRLDQGRLDEARDIANGVHRLERLTLLMRMPAANVLALARARLGDDSDYVRLEQALADAVSIGEPQYVVPARLALVETSWLRGDEEVYREHIAALGALPLDRLNSWNFGDVAVWWHRCAASAAIPGHGQVLPGPRQLEIAGRHAEAADALMQLGMRYDAALALAHATGEGAGGNMAKAVHLFEELGAMAGVDFTRRRAQRLGVLDQLPRRKRGPYAKARSHPLGLTGREVQLLGYLKHGMSNREISIEVRRSQRTVEHHISAILAKLGVRNRLEALIRIQNEHWLLGSD